MFEPETYIDRRNRLRSVVQEGGILLLGHREVPRNYRDNVYPFRQNSHVLYFSGVSRPNLALWVDADPRKDCLYGPKTDVDDIIWHGPHPTLDDEASNAGIPEVQPMENLATDLDLVRAAGGKIHYPPPFSDAGLNDLVRVLSLKQDEVRNGFSRELVHRIVELRLVKSEDEILEVENALTITAEMHVTALRVARPGTMEADVAAAIQKVALANDRQQAYNPIVTVHGEVLHNHTHTNRLESGHLLLNDSGAESGRFYASDITRTFPVNGRFTSTQKTIYSLVLEAQLEAIAAIRPGRSYREVHLLASRRMAEGLRAAGLMKGSVEDAVALGAHALFFPHGLGHMLGLDVHDMEDLGDVVGYAPGEKRSTIFGLNYLRYARPLETGFIVTVEPGVYFIPALIDRWKSENRHRDFINYEALEAFRNFGGIRIEDDVLCTAQGARVLGPAIPKTLAEIESLMAD